MDTGCGEADLLEVGAGHVVDGLGADLVGRVGSGGGLVLARLRLLLGEVEGGGRVEVGELGALGELDAAAGDVDLRQGDQAVAGLVLEQVVDGLGGGAPATGRDEGAAGQVLLVDGEGHGGLGRLRGGDGGALVEGLADDGQAMTLAHGAASASSGGVGAGVEALEAAVERDSQVLKGSVGVGGEAGDVGHGHAGLSGVLHGGLLSDRRCGGVNVPADAGQLDGATRGGCGDGLRLGVDLSLGLDVGRGGLGLLLSLLGLVLSGIGLLLGRGVVRAIRVIGGSVVLVVIGGGGLGVIGRLVGPDLGSHLGGLGGALGGGLLAGADLGGEDLDAVGQGAEGGKVLIGELTIGVQSLEGVDGLGAQVVEVGGAQVGQVLGDLQVEGLDRSVVGLVGEDGDIEVLSHVEGSSVSRCWAGFPSPAGYTRGPAAMPLAQRIHL